MSDLISRQAALREFEKDQYRIEYCKEHGIDRSISMEMVRIRLHNLPPATPKQRWIPVGERLPEQLKDVIVTDIETSNTYQSRYFGNGYWECDNGYFRNRIIAWMPLPKPYEPQESEDKE